MSLNSHFIASRIFIQTFEFAFAQAENLEIVEGFRITKFVKKFLC